MSVTIHLILQLVIPVFAQNMSYSGNKEIAPAQALSFLPEKQNFYQNLELRILIASLLPTSFFFHPIQ